MAVNYRSKLGYIAKDTIDSRILSGDFNEYDLILTSDTDEFIVIDDELNPHTVTSRVYVFDNIYAAEAELNNTTATYEGQLIAIKNGDLYRGYIVNLINGWYRVKPIVDSSDINYDTIGNRPVINLEDGSVLANQTDGVYELKGNYKISTNDPSTRVSVSGIFAMVSHNSDAIRIKVITSNQIEDYVVTDTTFESNGYITTKYLADNNYATQDWVTSQLNNLDFFTKEDAEEYINNYIDENLSADIESIVEEKIESQIATAQEVENIFN